MRFLSSLRWNQFLFSISGLQPSHQFRIILETVTRDKQLVCCGCISANSLDIPLTLLFTHETLLVAIPHMLEQLVGAEERFMAELDTQHTSA